MVRCFVFITFLFIVLGAKEWSFVQSCLTLTSLKVVCIRQNRLIGKYGTLSDCFGRMDCGLNPVILHLKQIRSNMENLRKGNLTVPEAQKYAIYNDGELALSQDMHDALRLLPVQLEVYAIFLVVEGKARIEINGKAYEISKEDLFICPPNNIVEHGLMSVDFKGYFIFVSSAYVQRIMPLQNAWSFKDVFEKNPICSLLPKEVEVFLQYYDLLCSKVQDSNPAQKRVIDTLVLAFVYDMENSLNRVVRDKQRPLTSGESIYRRFIDLLESSYPKQRTVSYYADCLHVTPKYLSSVCKQVGNKRPSDIIDSYVLKDIDRLMKHTAKSIKEIACELEFPNLSFFGKYVRKHSGLSPKAYREQIINGNKQRNME